MKQSIQQNPFLGGGARLAGFIPNTGPSSLVRRASAALAEGGSLLLFPEGTRTRRSARWINPFKGGCALIAAHAAVPVQPVFIRSDSRYLEKGWPFYRRPRFPIRIHVSLGNPLTPTPGESVHDFTHRLQDLFEHELSRPHPLRRTGTELTTPHQTG
jgi:1-acyl-sn-glycerol-3-phosphate acyltransferase